MSDSDVGRRTYGVGPGLALQYSENVQVLQTAPWKADRPLSTQSGNSN